MWRRLLGIGGGRGGGAAADLGRPFPLLVCSLPPLLLVVHFGTFGQWWWLLLLLLLLLTWLPALVLTAATAARGVSRRRLWRRRQLRLCKLEV